MESFDFKIITEGSFQDAGYDIRTVVIRLNPCAMDEYYSSAADVGTLFETKETWEDYRARKKAERICWERKILDKLKFKKLSGFSITRSLSEIFTVVLFERAEK